MKNYYHILDLEPGASEDEIRSAFRAKAKALHPDVNPSSDAHEQFLECQQAYAFLMDHTQRFNYDTMLRSEAISREELQRREMIYKLWVEHQQRKARSRTAMESVRYDVEGNPLRRKIWRSVNLVYNISFLLLFLSVIIIPIHSYTQELNRPETQQRSILFFLVPMLVGCIFLGYGYYYWFILNTDTEE